jgi:hypothetical protein
MAGDVNLFFNDHEDAHSAEVEVMVARPFFAVVSSFFLLPACSSSRRDVRARVPLPR